MRKVIEMNPARQKAVVVELLMRLQQNGSWCGETHLQKSMYVLQAGLGVPTGYRYIMYKHGPYSFELKESLFAMRAEGIVGATQRRPYGDSMYVDAEKVRLSDSVKQAMEPYQSAIAYVAERFAGSGVGVADLEKRSTALFVFNELGFDATDADVANRITELKPHVDADDALQAVVHMRNFLGAAPGLGEQRN